MILPPFRKSFLKPALLAAAAGAFLVFIGLYPQILLRHQRGAAYNNIYAYNDLDEPAYAAYLQSQIDRRPRRSNPYTGVDDAPDNRQPESLFSIQFVAPQSLAVLARVFGWDASAAMIFAAAFAAFAAAITVFCLLRAIAENDLFAAAGTLAVLCLGVLAIGEGAIAEIVNGAAAYPYFPFLRRYIPAVGFAFFWLFCLCVWRALESQIRFKVVFYQISASACFGFLVYSYFYLWTTAAAWLICLAAVRLFFRSQNRRRDALILIVVAATWLFWLLPYALLLSNRDRAMDSVQLLIRTRMPDLLRASEIFGVATLALLSFGVWRDRISPDDQSTVFTASFALLPFAVFNQQIVTGQSLQPIHYEVFIVNYAALLAFSTAIFLVWRGRTTILSNRLRAWLLAAAVFAAAWGVIEAHFTTRAIWAANLLRDHAKPVGDRLRALAQIDLFDESGNRRVVLPVNLVLGDDLPALAPQAVLWARHQHVFAGETALENKQRFYHYLYFANVEPVGLINNLRNQEIVTTIALFGWDRLTGRLSDRARPLTDGEIIAEADRYADFLETFSRREAERFRLSYIVVDRNRNFDFGRLDRWYERGAAEQINDFTLYELKLRE